MSYYISGCMTGKNDQTLVAIEDSIMQKGRPVTAGSKILSGFTSPLDATVISRLEAGGYAVSGKTKMREFGLLPLCEEACEASGAVRAVADGAVSFALCNDFSGVTRREAAENGICYIHPTYGCVSRYGLIPSACSMDQIGIVCRDIVEGFGLLSVIAGNDEKDGAMYPDKSYVYEPLDKKIKAFVPENVLTAAIPEDKAAVLALSSHFDGVSTELAYFDVLNKAQYILSCAEISANLSRYDGVKFGFRADRYNNLDGLYVNTRTQGFGLDAKLALIMGSMVLSKEYYTPCYEKALKLRRVIKDSLDFKSYDVILLPLRITGGAYESSAVHALAALAGLPCVSFSYNGGGVQILAAPKNENALLTVVKAVTR
ncbi:MAG: amidase family protein [Oscillospiraceae bacterium]|nr:amidase family protein [Oscillospiraceae bacterium]